MLERGWASELIELIPTGTPEGPTISEDGGLSLTDNVVQDSSQSPTVASLDSEEVEL